MYDRDEGEGNGDNGDNRDNEEEGNGYDMEQVQWGTSTMGKQYEGEAV